MSACFVAKITRLSYHIDGLDLSWGRVSAALINELTATRHLRSSFSFFSVAMLLVEIGRLGGADGDSRYRLRTNYLMSEKIKYELRIRFQSINIVIIRCPNIDATTIALMMCTGHVSPPRHYMEASTKFFFGLPLDHLRITLHPQDKIMENTRVFVSGLPPTFTNDQLRKHFSSRFQVTDAHVLPKRRIGFVGFKSPEAAQQAASYFNKTYVKMSKISVEIAKPVCHFCLVNNPDFGPMSCCHFRLRPLTSCKVGLETDQNVVDRL